MVMNADWLITAAAAGSILGYIIKALFDRHLRRDKQAASVRQTDVDVVKSWQEIALKAEADRKDTLQRLSSLHDELRELKSENQTLKSQLDFLQKKVNRLCAKQGGRPKEE